MLCFSASPRAVPVPRKPAAAAPAQVRSSDGRSVRLDICFVSLIAMQLRSLELTLYQRYILCLSSGEPSGLLRALKIVLCSQVAKAATLEARETETVQINSDAVVSSIASLSSPLQIVDQVNFSSFS